MKRAQQQKPSTIARAYTHSHIHTPKPYRSNEIKTWYCYFCSKKRTSSLILTESREKKDLLTYVILMYACVQCIDSALYALLNKMSTAYVWVIVLKEKEWYICYCSGLFQKRRGKNDKKTQMNSIIFFCIEIDIGTKGQVESHIDNGIWSLFLLSAVLPFCMRTV